MPCNRFFEYKRIVVRDSSCFAVPVLEELAVKKYIIVAADLHDGNMEIEYAVNLEAPKQKTFGTTSRSEKSVISMLKKEAKKVGGAEIHFAYEASIHGFGLYDTLTEAGIHGHVLAPTLLEKSAKNRKNKTDRKDAHRILEVLRGHLLAGNDLPEVWIPDDQTRDDREILRLRGKLSQKATASKTEIQCLLKRNKQTKPRAKMRSWTEAHWTWLTGLTGEDSALAPGARIALSCLLSQVTFQMTELDKLEKAIAELSKTDRYREPAKALLEIGGVGMLTAMTFLVELGDLSRFPNRRKFAAYLGLTPSSHESGEGSDRKGHITRQGSPRIRFVLCQAVWSGVQCNPWLKAMYDRIVARNPKKKKIAVVACMRRLAIRMWHAAQNARAAAAAPEGAAERRRCEKG